jgi:hypothetical protein
MNPFQKTDRIGSESPCFVGGANQVLANGEQGAAPALALFLAKAQPCFLRTLAKLGELVCSLADTMHSERESKEGNDMNARVRVVARNPGRTHKSSVL